MKKGQGASNKSAGVSDESVRRRTGKTWQEWFTVLDQWDANKKSHKEIAAWLHQNHIESGWWSQMVTIAYEQARGMREKHQKSDGYEISVSRILTVDVSTAFRAWQDEKQRGRWLGKQKIVVRKSIENKTLRITWPDGHTSLDVSFYNKGKNKCQVVAQHRKLMTLAAAIKMKKFWAESLNRLKGELTGS